MVKAMDRGIVVGEFELKSRYYVHFQADTLGERYDVHFQADTLGERYGPPYPPSYGLNSTTTVFLEEWL